MSNNFSIFYLKAQLEVNFFLASSWLKLETELSAVVAVEHPDQDKGEEDDGDGELVLSCVGSDLRKE